MTVTVTVALYARPPADPVFPFAFALEALEPLAPAIDAALPLSWPVSGIVFLVGREVLALRKGTIQQTTNLCQDGSNTGGHSRPVRQASYGDDDGDPIGLRT